MGVEVQGVIWRSVMESFVLQLGEAEEGQQEAHGAARQEGQPDFSAPKETASSGLCCVTGPWNCRGGKAPLEMVSTPGSSRVSRQRAGCLGSRPMGFGGSPQTETLEPLWAPHSHVWL